MIPRKRSIPFLATVVIYGFWALLRFFLMTKIRHIIFQNIELSEAQKVLCSHALIVLEAALLFAVYWFFKRARQTDEIRFIGNASHPVRVGMIWGLILFVTTIPVALYFGMQFSFQFSLPGAVGNIFSNAAEELIYRGILLSTIAMLFKKPWLGVVTSAVAFGLGHWDVPIIFQLYIVFVGGVLGWLAVKTRSLAAPYVAHTIADLLADSLFH